MEGSPEVTKRSCVALVILVFSFYFFFFWYSCYHESKILRQIDMCHYIIYQKNSIKCNKSGARTDYHFMIKMQKLREMHRDLTTDLVWSFYRINNLMIDRWTDSAKAQGNKITLFLACMQWYFFNIYLFHWRFGKGMF